MELITFKTLWGHPDTDSAESLALACAMAKEQGFAGIEGQIPADDSLRHSFAESLAHGGLRYIAEICTAGSYVPDRTASLADHVNDLHIQLKRLQPLKPLLVNCIGGCDLWPLETSLAFFASALELADKYGVTISFETHRGRSLYSPWVAEKLLAKMALPLTCDFSHWCVVCEGLGGSEDDLIRQVAGHAVHIHGRIGYDQGPQVSDPQAFLYRAAVEQHLRWWSWIWQAQRGQGKALTTLTPEFGPDGYQMVNPQTGVAVGDVNQINRWMAQKAAAAFQVFMGEKQ